MLRHLALLLLVSASSAGTLEVGPKKDHDSIMAAYKAARPGDTIRVYPLPDGQAYTRVALRINKPNITIQGVVRVGERVKIDGTGANVSGRRPHPRAMFQFDRGADGCVLEGFELYNARNKGRNGAGVRINEANDVVVRDCEIHTCDTGVMSNGRMGRAKNIQILNCEIHHNGSKRAHNLYMDGTSVLIRGCEIHHSTSGHNFKSRARYNRLEYCYIHDAGNQELNIVDRKGLTDSPGADTVVLGCVIVKARVMKGNQKVIHFGHDHKTGHDGTLYIAQSTIVTHYRSAVFFVTAPKGKVVLWNSIVWNTAGRGKLCEAFYDGRVENVSGQNNLFSNGYTLGSPTALSRKENLTGRRSPFVDEAEGNFRIKSGSVAADAGLPLDRLVLPPMPGRKSENKLMLFEYRTPLRTPLRAAKQPPDLGALGN